MRAQSLANSRFWHWLIAACVLGALVTGYAMTRSEAFSLPLLRTHLTLGVSAGVLSLIRVFLWLIKGPPPRVFQETSKLQALVSSIVHGVLRLLPLVLLISGIGMVTLSGAFGALIGGSLQSLSVFAELPPRNLHHAAALLLVLLTALHASAAAWHWHWLARQSARSVR